MDKELREMMGNLSDEEFNRITNNAKENLKQQQIRKGKSKFVCRIPDWIEQGGMIEFWINEDGSFETMDSRINDSDMRKELINLANN